MIAHGTCLLVVYNTDSDVLMAVKDYSTGPLSGSGHGKCHLSEITQSPLGMKKDWKRFVQGLGVRARFLNRNEFSSEAAPRLTRFPAIFLQAGKELCLIASSEEIDRCQCLEDLIGLVQSRFRVSC